MFLDSSSLHQKGVRNFDGSVASDIWHHLSLYVCGASQGLHPKITVSLLDSLCSNNCLPHWHGLLWKRSPQFSNQLHIPWDFYRSRRFHVGHIERQIQCRCHHDRYWYHSRSHFGSDSIRFSNEDWLHGLRRYVIILFKYRHLLLEINPF